MKAVFCFTSDLDWAPESMIEEMLGLYSDYAVPLTPFITHHSRAIQQQYRGDEERYVGVHPNFLPGSTHGNTLKEVVAHVKNLWPTAKCFRAHNYVDSLLITQAFYNEGFNYDSNQCLYLQPDITVQNHVSGLLRFPVFLEDFLFADKDRSWKIPRSALASSGLKVFNFHPVHICLNTPSVEYYRRVRQQVYEGKDWKGLTYQGKGVRTFLEELLQLMETYEPLYLDDVYNAVAPPQRPQGISPFSMDSQPRTPASVWTGSGLLKSYESANAEERQQILQTVMDGIDGKAVYATSPDFNLRELEIDFIIDSINREVTRPIPDILDIGCGNGYTDLRIAQAVDARIIGVDYSKAMIEGAKHLRNSFEGLKNPPMFFKGDVIKDLKPLMKYDVIISERLLLNLPDRHAQFAMINEIHALLKTGGIFIMVEGTRNGLRQLNEVRVKMGLTAIPDTSESNVSSLKFEEEELESFLQQRFIMLKKQHFGMYYLISRVVHPLLVQPESPKYSAKINEVARKVASCYPDYKQMSHVVGYILKKKVGQ